MCEEQKLVIISLRLKTHAETTKLLRNSNKVTFLSKTT